MRSAASCAGRTKPTITPTRRSRARPLCTTARCTCRCLRSKSLPPRNPAYECCTFRGAVLALDAYSGTSRWKAFTIPTAPREAGRTRVGTRILAPSGAPIWNSPAIDAQRGVLYVGTGENYSSPANDTSDALIAFRLQDGAMVWYAQKTANDAWNVACMLPDNPNCPKENGPDVDFGASTIVLRDAKRGDLLLAGQKSGWVYGVEPGRARQDRLEQQGRARWHPGRRALRAWPPTANGFSCRSRT